MVAEVKNHKIRYSRQQEQLQNYYYYTTTV